MSAPKVLSNIALPTPSVKNFDELNAFLTQQNNAIQQWVATVSNLINPLNGINPGVYTITVSGAGNLIVTGMLGTQSIIGVP